MADTKVEIVISAKDQATAALKDLGAQLKKLGDEVSGAAAGSTRKVAHEATNAARSLDTAATAARNFGSQLAKAVGISLTLAGAIMAARSAMSSWHNLISSSINTIDQYRMQIIGTAAAMTDMADTVVAPDYAENYRQFKAYAAWLFQQAQVVDEKVASSAMDVFNVATEFAKRGVQAVSTEQVQVAGMLAAKIRSIAPAYGEGAAAANQFRQEIRDLLEGNVRMNSQLATAFQQQDANFKENIKRARETGTVYEYLRTLLKGMEVAAADIGNTWGSVHDSLKATWALLQIRAFDQAYEDVVRFAQELLGTLRQQGELTEHGERLAQALAQAWNEVKETIREAFEQILADPSAAINNVKAIAEAVGSIASAAVKSANAINTVFSALTALSNHPLSYALGGAAIGVRVGGAPGAMVGAVGGLAVYGAAKGTITGTGTDYWQPEAAETPMVGYGTEAAGHVGVEVPTAPKPSGAPPTPPMRKYGAGGKEGGGGGGGRGGGKAIDPLAELYKQQQKELQELVKELNEFNRETQKVADGNLKAWQQYQEGKIRIERETHEQTIRLASEVMKNENASYAERSAAAEVFRQESIAAVDKEIKELREKYQLIPNDILESYRKAQIDQINKQISTTTGSLTLDWEAAWKRAAENVQDALANTIYSLVTQTKSAGDVLVNIFNGIANILSQMAAKALMDMARVAIESSGLFGSGGGGGFLSSMFGWIGSLFGFGGGSSGGTFTGMVGGYTPSAALPGYIPAMQHGGIVTKPTLALVGEAGPEKIIPLDRADEFEGRSIHIHINAVDGPSVRRLFERHGDQLMDALKRPLRNYRSL